MGNNYAILITILLLSLGININLSSQNLAPWQIEHSQLSSPYLATENSKPNPTSFDNMIGATGGKEIGNYFNPQFNSIGVINSFRSFHLMEADFGDAFFPSERTLPTIPCDCGAVIYSCPESKKCEQGNPTRNEYGFRGYKAQYCDWKNDARFQIREVYAAIETQIPIKGNYCNEVVNNECVDFNLNPCLIADGRDTIPGRKFPNKWYSFEEWGGSESAVEQNAYNYTYHFAATFCPADTSKDCVVQVLELGNEPWGVLHPGRAGYHAIVRGAVQACKDLYGVDKNNWRMRLSTAAFDARFACDNAPMQYVQDMIPDDPEIKKYLDFISIHNYPFIKSPCGVEVADLKLAYAPESPNGSFLALKNMDEWRRRNQMEHARINTTEVGWNSDQEDCNFGVGRANKLYAVANSCDGLFEMNPQLKTQKVIPTLGLEGAYQIFSTVLVTQKGNLWVGGRASKGRSGDHFKRPTLFYLDKSIGKLRPFEQLKGSAPFRVSSLAQDTTGLIWFGTREEGLKLIHPEQSEQIIHPYMDNLPRTPIDQVLIDKQNNPWLTTQKGIYFLDKTINYFQNYSEKDGLNFNRFYQHGYYTFRVQRTGFPETERSIEIIIHPPWWKSWWAYSTYGLLFFASIFVGYRFLSSRQRVRQEATHLREINAFKSKLYANITHEFRTPLTVILGLSEQLQKANLGTAVDKKILGITNNGNRIIQLVNQILDLKKLQTDKLQLRKHH